VKHFAEKQKIASKDEDIAIKYQHPTMNKAKNTLYSISFHHNLWLQQSASENP